MCDLVWRRLLKGTKEGDNHRDKSLPDLTGLYGKFLQVCLNNLYQVQVVINHYLSVIAINYNTQ